MIQKPMLSVGTKTELQMLAKMGSDKWALGKPAASLARLMELALIVGIDVHHYGERTGFFEACDTGDGEATGGGGANLAATNNNNSGSVNQPSGSQNLLLPSNNDDDDDDDLQRVLVELPADGQVDKPVISDCCINKHVADVAGRTETLEREIGELESFNASLRKRMNFYSEP